MYLAANLDVLRRRNPALARKVAEAGDEAEVLPTAEGPTLRLACDGRRVLLHSRMRPRSEAGELVGGLDLEGGRLFAVVGFGCGYHVEELLCRIHPVARVLVLEPSPAALKGALRARDLRHVLGNPRVALVDASEAGWGSAVHDLILEVPYLTGCLEFVALPAYASLWPDRVAEFRRLVAETVRYVAMMAGNCVADTLQGLTQAFANTEYMLRAPDLAALRAAYRGVPAFCVAAGPSLEKNVRELRAAQGRSLIICADTILERLLREGIVPDVVCVLERGRTVYEYFFEGKAYPPEVTLVGQSVIYPEIFRTFAGPRVVALKEGLIVDHWLASMLPHVPIFRAGSSVGNMNFGLARYLGCDPIVLVGQDLAYGEDGQTHAGGTVYERKRPAGPPLPDEYIQGKDGRMLRTHAIWKQFHRWFEVEVARTPQRCIDATEGGALIRGTEVARLRDVVRQFCREPVRPLRERLREATPEEYEARWRALGDGVEGELRRLDDVVRLLRGTWAKLGRFEKAARRCRRGGRSFPALKYLVPVQEGIKKLAPASPLFTFIMQPLIMKLNW
ncbi:MAG: motility associated factor glycosyltransferase family protein, partial [Desulfotomaculales bacterium]